MTVPGLALGSYPSSGLALRDALPQVASGGRPGLLYLPDVAGSRSCNCLCPLGLPVASRHIAFVPSICCSLVRALRCIRLISIAITLPCPVCPSVGLPCLSVAGREVSSAWLCQDAADPHVSHPHPCSWLFCIFSTS